MSFKLNNINRKKDFGFNTEGISREKCDFHSIYFLDNLTGSLLVSKKYSGNLNPSSNGDLISGFLNALNLFIKEIKPGSREDEIQEINFRETRILYEKKGRLSVIAITKKSDLKYERLILHQIVIDFYNLFEDNLTRFNGVIEPSILNYKKKLEMLNFYNFDFDI